MNQPTALPERRPSSHPDTDYARVPPPPSRRSSPRLPALIRLGIDLVAVVTGVLLALLPAGHHLGGPATISAVAFAVSVLVLLDPRRAFRRWATSGVLDSAVRSAGACAIGTMLAIAAAVLAGDPRPDAHSLRLWTFTTALLVALRGGVILAERHARRRGAMAIPTLIVGAGAVGIWVARRLAQQASLGLRPVGFLDADPPCESELDLPVLGSPGEVIEVAADTGAQQIIIAFSLECDQALADAVKRCHAAGLAVAAVPRLYESLSDRAVLDHVGGLPLMSFEPISPHGWQFALKHVFDRLSALAGCLVVSPLLLAIAGAVKLSSPGPVIYRQRRVGRGGREFDLLKFRSMAHDPSGRRFVPDGGLAPGGIEGADRRTRIGRWLRNSSLDELPQLVNVLRGEMSLIGPRPERPDYVARFSASIPRYAERHRVRPGITGWAQVHGLRGQTSIADRAEWDNHYIDNWSLAMELRTLAMTIAAVLLFRESRAPAVPDLAAATGALGPAAEAPPARRAPLLAAPEPVPAVARAGSRPSLALVGSAGQPINEGRWFCGYCGAEPAGGLPAPFQRVCEKCSLGVLLEADSDAAPAPGDAFLVIDSRLTVQALSERAEQILGIREPDATSRPVTELLVDAAAETAENDNLAAAIAQAASDDGGAWSGFVRPRGDFGIRTRVRVTHCGPPRAALLILEDVATRPPLRLIDADSGSALSAQA